MKTRLLRCTALRETLAATTIAWFSYFPRPARGGLLHPIMHVTWLWEECVTATTQLLHYLMATCLKLVGRGFHGEEEMGAAG